MVYERPEIESGVTRLNKAFFDNAFDGIDEKLTREEADAFYSPVPEGSLTEFGITVADLAAANGFRYATVEEVMTQALGWAVVTDPRFAGGAKGNGVTDDGAAITAALNSLVAIPNSFGAAGVLYFPAGQFIDSHNHVIPNDRRIRIIGCGPQISILKRPAGAIGDWWTINSSSSRISDIGLEGGRYQGVTGDGVVLNAAYCYVERVQINKIGGTGLVVGKAGAAIAAHLNDIQMRENLVYGIWTIAASDSTDCVWMNIDIGNTGQSGVRLDCGAQNITNLHVWGSGLESATEYHGIWVNSTGNLFTNWQSEKNLGAGVYLTGSFNEFVSGRSWGNTLAGVRCNASALRNTFAGNQIYWNGTPNTSGGGTLSFAGMHLEGAQEWTVTGNNIWDSAQIISANTYVTQPTYPYLGRPTAVITQSYAIAEAGAADFNTYVGNTLRSQRQRLGSILNVGNSNIWGNNDHGAMPLPTRDVSSNVVRIPAESDTIIVVAPQEITSVVGHRPGRVARIIFTAATPLPVRDNGTTLNLAGDFTPVKGSVLSLVSDGTNWYEVARSLN